MCVFESVLHEALNLRDDHPLVCLLLSPFPLHIYHRFRHRN
jgi:hypothetical protein